jgi:glycosyltransferase involved in cell wall biosynthesis
LVVARNNWDELSMSTEFTSTGISITRPASVAPAVSVIMPTRNGERFLRPAIESILNQIFTDFELIVVDDGSTDSTPRILSEFQDNRLMVLRNERNLGIAGATNRGLAAARGEYVALQDHDDISLPHRFQTQVDFLNTHPEIALVGSAATLIDDKGMAYAEFPLPCEEIDIKWRLLFFGDAFHYTSLMVRRNAMLEIGGYGEDPAFRFSEAYDPFSRLAMHHQMVNLPDKLVLWRRHPDATSLQHQREQLRSGEIISRQAVSFLCELGSNKSRYDGDLPYYYSGFKAFTSTPGGQLPLLSAEQVLSSLEFFREVQNSFYRLHRFSKAVISRHRKPLSWTWGKHAIALAIRAPWAWRERIRSFGLGISCLADAAWATLVHIGNKSIGRGSEPHGVTVPTIRPLRSPAEQLR